MWCSGFGHQQYSKNSFQLEQWMHSQGQDERATQHAVNKATPSIANLVNHWQDMAGYSWFVASHKQEGMQHRITSSICSNQQPCSKDMMNSINGITRFLLSSFTIHVEQSTTGCLWPTKQDRRQPFNTREVSTSRQNAIHHQASQNHLGTNMPDTVRISSIIYRDWCTCMYSKNSIIYIYILYLCDIQNAYAVIWPTEGLLLSMQKNGGRYLSVGLPLPVFTLIYNFIQSIWSLQCTTILQTSNSSFFLGGRGGFVQSD